MFNLSILTFRVLVAFAMIRIHGLKKIVDIQSTIEHIPDPFSLGGAVSTAITNTANLFFATLVGLGFLTRPSAIFDVFSGFWPNPHGRNR